MSEEKGLNEVQRSRQQTDGLVMCSKAKDNECDKSIAHKSSETAIIASVTRKMKLLVMVRERRRGEDG